MQADFLMALFHFDVLAGVMVALVSSIGLIIGVFARTYMQGDSEYHSFFARLAGLVLSVVVLVTADHFLLLLAAWGISNLLLVRLMVHKPVWKAASHSGWLAAKTFFISFICLSSAFALLYHSTAETSVQAILRSFDAGDPATIAALSLIAVAAMAQSAIWPFHSWLLSSLNSPTPVSAIMHAGLVNGGGFLLVRFSPLFLSQSPLLNIIFILGLGTAIIGTLWKLMQHDMKRMLACSTMAQMGFMLVQCGLGLFPFAVTHLCWHGFFKANLFLSSNSIVREKRVLPTSSPTVLQFVLACLSGGFGTYLFVLAGHRLWLELNTTLVLLVIVFIAAVQFSMNFLRGAPWKKLPLTLVFTGLVWMLYGYSVSALEFILTPLHLMQPQELNIIHMGGLILLIFLWVLMLFKERLLRKKKWLSLFPKLYVKMLNASQPHPLTITPNRQHYQYDRG